MDGWSNRSNLPNLAQLQRPGCRVSTDTQVSGDCHVAVAPRNDNNFLSRHCEARSNLTILAPEQDCHVAVAPRNDNNYLSRHCEARSNLTILAPEQDCHAAVAARNDV